MEFLSFSPTPSVNDTKKHRLPVEKPSLSVAHKNNLYQRWTELRSAECWKSQFISAYHATHLLLALCVCRNLFRISLWHVAVQIVLVLIFFTFNLSHDENLLNLCKKKYIWRHLLDRDRTSSERGCSCKQLIPFFFNRRLLSKVWQHFWVGIVRK